MNWQSKAGLTDTKARAPYLRKPIGKLSHDCSGLVEFQVLILGKICSQRAARGQTAAKSGRARR
jgi:hypothetical protein